MLNRVTRIVKDSNVIDYLEPQMETISIVSKKVLNDYIKESRKYILHSNSNNIQDVYEEYVNYHSNEIRNLLKLTLEEIINEDNYPNLKSNKGTEWSGWFDSYGKNIVDDLSDDLQIKFYKLSPKSKQAFATAVNDNSPEGTSTTYDAFDRGLNAAMRVTNDDNDREILKGIARDQGVSLIDSTPTPTQQVADNVVETISTWRDKINEFFSDARDLFNTIEPGYIKIGAFVTLGVGLLAVGLFTRGNKALLKSLYNDINKFTAKLPVDLQSKLIIIEKKFFIDNEKLIQNKRIMSKDDMKRVLIQSYRSYFENYFKIVGSNSKISSYTEFRKNYDKLYDRYIALDRKIYSQSQ
jgi:hypothetical protein